MDGVDHLSVYFRQMSNRDLVEKIERLKRTFATLQLPDGGKKFEINIKHHEDELERRLKDDEKCKNQPEFHELSLSGVSDGSREQTSSSLTNDGSEFSKSCLKKLEKQVINKTDSTTEDAFRTELSTLNCSDHKRKRVRSSSSMEKHNRGLSAKRRKSYQGQASYGLRSCNTVVIVDEDECEIAATTAQVSQDECLKEARIYYPSRYLQQHIYSMSRQADGYHFFNTYFYEKLKEAVRKKNDNETFAKIRGWWKGVKLFEKAYIFLPIHEDLHWSLVIICIPDKEAGRGSILLHFDSLDLHPSKLIFENIRRFLIQEWDFLRKEECHMDFPFPEKIWNNLPRRIDEQRIEVPQQRNDYDCGLFVLFFIERFMEKAPERVKKNLPTFGRQWFKPKEASNLRDSIRNLLEEEFNKAKENNCLVDA